MEIEFPLIQNHNTKKAVNKDHALALFNSLQPWYYLPPYLPFVCGILSRRSIQRTNDTTDGAVADLIHHTNYIDIIIFVIMAVIANHPSFNPEQFSPYINVDFCMAIHIHYASVWYSAHIVKLEDTKEDKFASVVNHLEDEDPVFDNDSMSISSSSRVDKVAVLDRIDGLEDQ